MAWRAPEGAVESEAGHAVGAASAERGDALDVVVTKSIGFKFESRLNQLEVASEGNGLGECVDGLASYGGDGHGCAKLRGISVEAVETDPNTGLFSGAYLLWRSIQISSMAL